MILAVAQRIRITPDKPEHVLRSDLQEINHG
jgi:hypothetical protein